ncbi:hypothetical protein AK830_g604 [Neonectria ditissima]|uniref:Uncharacterized protein n=1 Tax=Neonectria ditissima TaxID=78410 RepID=A0A0P7BKS0_9HYPO|nr:hypothetical protein AK830_g604 [Neonectria ditissima]
MDHNTRTTSFEKQTAKTKETAPKSKTRSSSLLMISSGMTFLAAIPQRAGTTTSMRSSTRRSLPFNETLKDHSDEFFELHHSRLVVEIRVLVERAFCPTGRPNIYPWLESYPEQFLKLVELVARPDPHAGLWARLLRDGAERSCLLQAIITKIIDTKVFSSLLFGADHEHQNILQSTDASLVNAEGFRRSYVRAQTNRLYLRSKRGLPPLFWEEIDRLCTQVFVLVVPVFSWTSKIQGWESPSAQELHQWLHDVIAYAGWLNICNRLSPAIIVSDWIKPGTLYDLNQVNLAHEVYVHSKEAAQKRVEMLSPAMGYNTTARVKISVGPEVFRYRPAKNEMEMEGVAKYTIMRPHVVYYEGRELDQDEEETFVNLPTYIIWLRDEKTMPHHAALAIMIIAALSLWVSFTSSGQRVWRLIQWCISQG